MASLRSVTSFDTGPVLYGDQVVLRIPQMSDFSAWADLRAVSRNFLVPWEPTWPADDLTRASFRRRIRRYQRDVHEGLTYPFFVYLRDDDVLVGGLTLSNIRRGVAQCCSVGYWIGEPYQRCGLMSDAVRTVLPFAFDVLNLHRVEAACLPTNKASINLLRGCQFTEEGFARRYLKINGVWQDHLLFAVVAGDI